MYTGKKRPAQSCLSARPEEQHKKADCTSSITDKSPGGQARVEACNWLRQQTREIRRRAGWALSLAHKIAALAALLENFSTIGMMTRDQLSTANHVAFCVINRLDWVQGEFELRRFVQNPDLLAAMDYALDELQREMRPMLNRKRGSLTSRAGMLARKPRNRSASPRHSRFPRNDEI